MKVPLKIHKLNVTYLYFQQIAIPKKWPSSKRSSPKRSSPQGTSPQRHHQALDHYRRLARQHWFRCRVRVKVGSHKKCFDVPNKFFQKLIINI